MHAGSYELFAHEGIRSIADLKGKRIAAESILLSLVAAYVGLDPKRDLNLVENRAAEPLELFAEGMLDAYLAFPPENQELHARKVGHVILRTAVDRPWSQCTGSVPCVVAFILIDANPAIVAGQELRTHFPAP